MTFTAIYKQRKVYVKVTRYPDVINIVVDMSAIMTKRAKNDGKIVWTFLHLVHEAPLILQYANDNYFYET